MSWTDGIKRNYTPPLRVQGDEVAYVEFLEEPKVYQKDDGDAVPYAQVKYLGGTAKMAIKGSDPEPATKGQNYTLWLTKTLRYSILDQFGWVEGMAPPKLTGKRFKIYRGDKKIFGNRVYVAELFEGEPVDVDEGAIQAENFKNSTLLKSLKSLGKLDHQTWYTFLRGEGVEDPEKLTDKMVELGYIRKDEKNVYPAEEK